ncbi:MAG: RagB/SusD family nutrient uptake outer membrane protein [Candidatus Pedobacter colombiensis]|uniref:RagB/SusD family nutrient uptake outer membrane protein n=1 Tax=Candidatus Pedobacter colombiensis TaxID=3121371 RepID=A0AAJ5W6H6_9SPHI|nr:RagB/SusD family nutrient uptake outer membrane protein [Pedobacter sp.]WEK18907.1 MAG: RagB/SusD family nutrient uptake outer membrane protein [Pedobacter sp.]
MKKITYTIILLATLGISLVSCKKFLEKEPIGRISKNLLFEDVNGAKAGLNGAYNQILSYYKNEFGLYGDVASDNLIKSTKASALLPQFNFQSLQSDDALAVGNIWLSILAATNNVNNVLASLPNLAAKFPDQTVRLDSIKGQALVMRALCHFDLSRVYAQPYNYTTDASHLGVPVLLKTPGPGEQVSRKTMKETYDQIIADLNQALPLLEKTNNHTSQFSISYQAALALLSRVYLYKGDWAQCIANSDKVINDNNYVLATADNYLSTFLAPGKTANGRKIEGIFQLSNIVLTYSSSGVFVVLSDALSAQYTASAKILNLLNGDIRVSMFNTVLTGENKDKTITRKYADGAVNTMNPQTIQVIRLSEIYLNRAEARWNLGQYPQAAEDIRIISQRAHPNTTINISSSDPALLYKIIADERNRELCFENHRFFDIVRRKENLQRGGDCNATTCSLTYPNNKFALPIPVKEVEANKGMIQNPGYN